MRSIRRRTRRSCSRSICLTRLRSMSRTPGASALPAFWRRWRSIPIATTAGIAAATTGPKTPRPSPPISVRRCATPSPQPRRLRAPAVAAATLRAAAHPAAARPVAAAAVAAAAGGKRPSLGRSLAVGVDDQHVIEMIDDRVVAAAGLALEGEGIAHHQGTAPRLDDVFRLEVRNDSRRVATPDAQHQSELLVGDRHRLRADAPGRGRQPLGGALFDGVDGVAGNRLKALREKTVGIAHEEMVKRPRLAFRQFELTDRYLDEGAAELHHNPGECRREAVAHDAADGALVSNQHGLDIAAVLDRDDERGRACVTREEHRLNVFARMIQNLVGCKFDAFEVWSEQLVILIGHAAQ